MQDSIHDDTSNECCQNLGLFEEGDHLIQELLQCIQLEISQIDNHDHSDQNQLFHAYLPLNAIISKYQYQPQLMDTHLNRIIAPIMDFIRSYHFVKPNAIQVHVYEFLVNIANARGYKYIVKFFSHEVSDLEGLLSIISSINPTKSHLWHVRYILLLWLSFVTMLPFEINRLSCQDQPVSIVQRLLDTSKSFLNHAGKERDAATILIGRLVSRVDVAPIELTNLIAWATDIVETNPTTFLVTSALQSLCSVLKYTDRSLLLPHAELLVDFQARFIALPIIQQNNLLRKLVMKYMTRVALALLPNRVPKWRYDRGSRSLEHNILRKGQSSHAQVLPNQEDTDDVSNHTVPDTIETVLNLMLNGLRDKDTIVRWSAAKGIGRITFRLVKQDMAQDIIDAVIDLFSENVYIPPTANARLDISSVSEHTWHGACLAIAELSRRGLLIPAKLPKTLPWISLALTFDQQRGAHSVGSYVRDSACYVCWSFARAYSPTLMLEHVYDLAPMLITTALYDREIHVRRAASAAFQENVGRQGVFPFGIEVVNATDFFTIGNRVLAFTSAAKLVASFDVYHPYQVAYLLDHSVFHWDVHVRRVAADGLSVLAELQPSIFKSLVDQLIVHVNSSDLPQRHGSMLSMAAIMNVCPTQVKPELQTRIYDHFIQLTDLQLHGFGSELTREAALNLGEVIVKSSEKVIPELIDHILLMIETSLERKEPILHKHAAQTCAQLYRHFSADKGLSVLNKWITCTKATYDVKDIQARRGYALALGSLHLLSKDQVMQVISGLVHNVYLDPVTKGKQGYDAETKRNATQSLGQLLQRYSSILLAGYTSLQMNGQECIKMTIDAFIKGLDDYTTNTHGDVGSLIRMESVHSIVRIIEHHVEISPIKIQEIVKKLIELALSRIDRIRQLASTSLTRILTFPKIKMSIANGDQLIQVMNQIEHVSDTDDKSTFIFTKYVQLLDTDMYRDSVMLGVLVCMGNGTDTLSKNVGSVVMDYLESASVSGMDQGCASILRIMCMYRRKDRVVIPVIQALDILYTNLILNRASESVHCTVFQFVTDVIDRNPEAGAMGKVLGGLQVIGGLVGIQCTSEKAIQYLIKQISHTIPRVRKAVIEVLMDSVSLYVQVYEEMNGIPLDEGRLQEVEQVLGTMKWWMCFFTLFITYIPVLIVTILMGWSLYAFLFHVGSMMHTTTTLRVFSSTLVTLIWVLTYWAYLNVILTNPGFSPLINDTHSHLPTTNDNCDDIPLVTVDHDQVRHHQGIPLSQLSTQPHSHATYNSVNTHSSSAAVVETEFQQVPMSSISAKQNGSARFCRKCNAPKPDRAQHGRTCKRCILKMDHHCPWVATCVGFANYKFFLLFVIYLALYCILEFAFTVKYFFVSLDYLDSASLLHTAVHVILLAVTTFLFGVVMIGFSIFHLSLVYYNQTTIESLETQRFVDAHETSTSESSVTNPWDLGWRLNWMQVFGPHVWKWFLPIKSYEGDGMTFPIRTLDMDHEGSIPSA